MSEWNKIKLEMLKRENKEERKVDRTWQYTLLVDCTVGNVVDYSIFVQMFLIM
jgi:hypothetical protein